jgi:hypothetical protein
MQQLREKIAIEIPPHSIYEVIYRNNKIDLYQQVPGSDSVCIRSYIIIIIPIVVDLSALQGFSGDVCFNCEEILSELNCAVRKLKFIEGSHVGRGNNEALGKLDRILHDISDEYRTSEDIRQVGSILSTGVSTEEEDTSVPWAN